MKRKLSKLSEKEPENDLDKIMNMDSQEFEETGEMSLNDLEPKFLRELEALPQSDSEMPLPPQSKKKQTTLRTKPN